MLAAVVATAVQLTAMSAVVQLWLTVVTVALAALKSQIFLF